MQQLLFSRQINGRPFCRSQVWKQLSWRQLRQTVSEHIGPRHSSDLVCDTCHMPYRDDDHAVVNLSNLSQCPYLDSSCLRCLYNFINVHSLELGIRPLESTMEAQRYPEDYGLQNYPQEMNLNMLIDESLRVFNLVRKDQAADAPVIGPAERSKMIARLEPLIDQIFTTS